MSHALKFLSLLTLVFVALSGSVPAQVVFKNVSVISFAPEKTTNGQTVVIVDGKIAKIGSDREVKIPSGATVVDGSGKFLMPGMMDSHTHLPGPQGLDMAMKDYLLLQLAHGVTSLRVSRYEPEFLELRKKIQKEKWPAPRMFLPAPTISRSAASIKDPVATFKQYKALGYDHIKYLSGLTQVEHEAYILAARKAGLPFYGHLLPHLDLKRTIEIRPTGIEHLHGFTKLQNDGKIDELKEMIKATAQRKIFHCPTVSWYNGFTLNFDDPEKEFRSRPGLQYMPKALVKSWDKWLVQRKGERIDGDKKVREKVMARLVNSGIPMLLSPGDGYYFVPGLAMYEEMKVFKRAGFSNFAILKAATYNGAAFYGQTSSFGNLKEGLRAELVLLAANPVENLKNIHKIEGVMLGNRWFDKTKLKESLENMASSRK